MSIQTLTAPETFGTTTITAHQGVGSLTWDITPKLSIHFNSLCIFGLGVWDIFWCA